MVNRRLAVVVVVAVQLADLPINLMLISRGDDTEFAGETDTLNQFC